MRFEPMPTSQTSVALQQLLASFGRDGAGMTDGELLDRFLQRRDEAAVAALVRRHAPMVWGVCRRVLRSHHDAEDAFQATFLVLVRKAATIRDKGRVANWLYGVAHQTAVRLRAAGAKRAVRERQLVQMPEPAVIEARGDDLLPLLDQELSRLPDSYREVIVLCDLEGKTRKEAARQLGLPEGTVASRLVRARAMLAKRLARHGPAGSGGALAAVLSHNAASAGVPSSVVTSTIKAASVLAAGQPAAGVISVKVAALTEGVLKTMLLTKLKIASVVLLVVLACVGGGTVAFLPVAAGRQPTSTEKQEGKRQAAKKAEDAFPGEWALADGQAGGLTRLVITKTDDGWSIQAWGSAAGEEKDQGKATLYLLRDYEGQGDTDDEKTMSKYGFATWNHKFAKSHVTLRMENDRLIGEQYTVFKDGSGRPHYRSRYEFKRKD